MKLLIAIPAFNEEDSIQSIIDRSLDARRRIMAQSQVTDVEVTVVSDGSTDRTVELASKYAGRVNLIVFEKNRGYGAAIKEAWSRSDAEMLGFLDADGTCDPNFFSQLCAVMDQEKADVALGCRMSAASRMPWVRRAGNQLFAGLLRLLSCEPVRDTASGMRVVRRESIHKLMPLPDGLHFTPAMSARALLSQGVRIAEIDMPYHERQGESKLRVGQDGLRFLRVILDAAFLYRPSRPLGLFGLAWLAVAVSLMVTPALYYLRNHSVAEWMIYRFVVSHLAGTSACLLGCASYLAGRMADLTVGSNPEGSRPPGRLSAFLNSPWFWLVPAAMMLAGGALVLPSFLELVRTGATYEHWSRFIGMTFLFSTALTLLVTRVMDYALGLIERQLAYWKTREGKPAGRE